MFRCTRYIFNYIFTVLFKIVFKTIISFVQNVRFFGQKDKMKTLATLCIWAA